MGVSYEKCDMCHECYDDYGNNYPMSIEDSNKRVCPECFEEYWSKLGKVFEENEETGEYEYYNEDYEIKKEYNPFVDNAALVINAFNDFIKKWCGDHYPHLIDTDENDGEQFRKLLREHIK